MSRAMRWLSAAILIVLVSLGVAAGPALAAARVVSAVDPGSSLSHLPDDWAQRRAALATRFGLEPSPASEAVARAINPGDYECQPTEINDYVDSLVAGMSREELQFLANSGVLDFPTYDALLFGVDGDPRYALREQSTQLTHAFRDLQRFWDIYSSDIQLIAMHGDMLLDVDRLVRLLILGYGLSPADAEAYAHAVATIISVIPAFDRGNNPIFTLNAFAFSLRGAPSPLPNPIPDKIVYGDGLITALVTLGFGDAGPRVILGHEFGHHIQYEDGLIGPPLRDAETTRRQELMADAFGTYFAVHARGLALNAKRVLQTERMFYESGDCLFSNPLHHGTPNQRMRSSVWAAELADTARPQGKIQPSLSFAQLFLAELPVLVAPDA